MLQGYGRMLKSCRQGELNKHLAVWLCCALDSLTADYYLCQHCRNYVYIKKGEINHIPGWDETTPTEWGNLDQLYQAFLGLSPDQRVVIYLKIVKGFSNHDVAEALSKSIGAVKAIQSQGLRTLLHLLYSRQEYMAI